MGAGFVVLGRQSAEQLAGRLAGRGHNVALVRDGPDHSQFVTDFGMKQIPNGFEVGCQLTDPLAASRAIGQAVDAVDTIRAFVHVVASPPEGKPLIGMSRESWIATVDEVWRAIAVGGAIAQHKPAGPVSLMIVMDADDRACPANRVPASTVAEALRSLIKSLARQLGPQELRVVGLATRLRHAQLSEHLTIPEEDVEAIETLANSALMPMTGTTVMLDHGEWMAS